METRQNDRKKCQQNACAAVRILRGPTRAFFPVTTRGQILHFLMNIHEWGQKTVPIGLHYAESVGGVSAATLTR